MDTIDIFASFGGVTGDPMCQLVTKFVMYECNRRRPADDYFCSAFSGPMNFS